MNEILNELKLRLCDTNTKFLLHYNADGFCIENTYEFLDYNFSPTAETWNITNGSEEIEIILEHIKNVEYESDDDEYIITLKTGMLFIAIF